MIVLLKKINNKLPKYMKLKKTINDSLFEVSENEILTHDGKYKYNDYDDYKIYSKTNDKQYFGNDVIDIYYNEYSPDEEIITVNGIISAIRTRSKISLKNVIFGLRDQYKYMINLNIEQRKIHSSITDKKLSSVAATNILTSLVSIDQIDIGPGKLFANTKLDGVTAIVAYLELYDLAICYDMKGKSINNRLFTFKPKKRPKNDQVFMGEYVSSNDKVYLFMEVNDLNYSFKLDYKNIDTFISTINDHRISKNLILISKENETYKGLTRRLLDRKKKIKDLPETDGIIYGILSNKIQYKWKPLNKNTIDFYVTFIDNYMILYAADKKYMAFKRLKDKKYLSRIRSKYKKRLNLLDKKTLGLDDYILQVYDIQLLEAEEIEEYYKFNKTISEFMYKDNKWMPYRIRKDKKTPNKFSVAESIFKTIENPIQLTDLI